jgi:hypothetical protein
MPETPNTALATPQPTESILTGLIQPPPATESDQRWLDAAQTISQLYKAGMTDVERHRPSYLANANTVACILGAIDSGLTPSQAGASLGFSHSVVSGWLDRAIDTAHPAHKAYAAFKEACDVAWNTRRRRLLGRLEKASEKEQHWTAGAWLLERGYGNDYKLAQDKQGGGVVIQIGIKDSELQLNIGDTSTPLTLDSRQP